MQAETDLSWAEGLDTFPKLLLTQAEMRPQKAAIREKDYGIWQEWSWSRYARETCACALGLAAHGFARGDKLALLGRNRPPLYAAIAACHCLGGIAVPLYEDAVADEVAGVLQHADACIVLAEDQEQVDKLVAIRDRCPELRWAFFIDPRGLGNYEQGWLHPYERLILEGREFGVQNHGYVRHEIATGKGSDVALISYTSGTTGQPKGVLLSHDNLRTSAINSVLFEGLRADEEVLAYLPLAWIGQSFFSYAQHLVAGYCVNCPESADTFLPDLREIAPTYFFAPPRIWENLLTSVMVRISDSAMPKQKLFHYFTAYAKNIGTRILDGEAVGAGPWLLYQLGRLLIYGPLKNVFGFNRLRVAYTAGEAIGGEIFSFYRSLGINIKQIYGSTEASVFICMQPDGEVSAETVGRPAKDVEVHVDESGEVLFRGPGAFHSYYKDQAATKAAKDAEGWVRTGDAGFFDEAGHLRILDRAKDVGKLADGTLFAPKYLENKLKFSPFIREAVVVGMAAQEVVAIINIDLEAVGNWAERRGIPYSGYTDLAAREEVYALVRDGIAQVNRDLAADDRLAGSQIGRFLILHKELDADDGELTRTRKVRRRFIAEKYAVLIDALQGDAEHCAIDTSITFEDGRTESVKAVLHIASAPKFHCGPDEQRPG